MLEVAVILPVLNRPRRVAPLLQSLRAADEPGIVTTPVFVCSDGDTAEQAAVRQAGLEPLILYSPGRSEFARKTNLAAVSVEAEWLFMGADDLAFHPGWARACLDKHDETGCLVIGTNDLGNSAVMAGRHSTHSMVHRDYLVCGTVDEPDSGKLLHEGYDHNSCDVEFWETAKARGQAAFAADAHVEHLHRLWGKAPMDGVYRKGLRNASADKRLYVSRRRLWAGNLAVR